MEGNLTPFISRRNGGEVSTVMDDRVGNVPTFERSWKVDG